MSFLDLALWGFVATGILTIIMAGAQRFGITRMSIPFMLGTMFTGQRDRAMLVGSAVHAVNGWLFAVIYIAVFEDLGVASWWLGAIMGAIHGLGVLLVIMPMLPGLHPRMASETQGPTPTRGLEPPGVLALNYGESTAVVTMAAHILYGAIIGGFYHLAT